METPPKRSESFWNRDQFQMRGKLDGLDVLEIWGNHIQSSIELFEQHSNNIWGSEEIHGLSWDLIDLIILKILFPNIVFSIWLMIMCYLSKFSKEILHITPISMVVIIIHFGHLSVIENGKRAMKMVSTNWLNTILNTPITCASL